MATHRTWFMKGPKIHLKNPSQMMRIFLTGVAHYTSPIDSRHLSDRFACNCDSSSFRWAGRLEVRVFTRHSIPAVRVNFGIYSSPWSIKSQARYTFQSTHAIVVFTSSFERREMHVWPPFNAVMLCRITEFKTNNKLVVTNIMLVS